MKHYELLPVTEQYKQKVAQHAQGQLSEVTYKSNHYINDKRQLVTNQNISSEQAGRETVTGEAITKKCNIYLPAGYDPNDKETTYDVVYLLHGVGGDQFEWLHGSGEQEGRYVLCHIIDHLIANGEIEPVIVVFPNGKSAHDWPDRSFNTEGTHLLGFYYFDYELKYDLIPFIESNYNTKAKIDASTGEAIAQNRQHRSIAGLSMGGMQCLNLVLGGYRHDSEKFTNTDGGWGNGLAATVPAPGLLDLFSRVGVFSNAPTSSTGDVVGSSIAASEHKLDLLFMTCGDEDGISISCFNNSIDGLMDKAADHIGQTYQTVIKGGKHDFGVWLVSVYNFLQMLNDRHSNV